MFRNLQVQNEFRRAAWVSQRPDHIVRARGSRQTEDTVSEQPAPATSELSETPASIKQQRGDVHAEVQAGDRGRAES